jgi:hypothetical protein
MEKARFLMKRIQVFNSKYIFIVDKKDHVGKIKPHNNLIVFYEKGIIPIQIHFKNSRYRKNFKIYK